MIILDKYPESSIWIRRIKIACYPLDELFLIPKRMKSTFVYSFVRPLGFELKILEKI